MDTLTFATLDTPIGRLTLIRSPRGLREIRFPDDPRPLPPGEAAAGDDPAAAQLAEYFAGGRRQFDLDLDPVGTAFQREVWDALRAIPAGETTSYGALARALHRPGAARAVGAANGANPLPIIVPCHRVIGTDGRLTGYAGGLPIKRALLTLEGALRP